MSSMSNALENGLLELLLKNTTFAGIGDSTGLVGSSTAGSFYLSLHTSDPGEGGDQTTNEVAYTGYARVAVARSGSGWTVTGNVASPVADILFGECTASPGDPATHVGIGTDSSGSGILLLHGELSPAITIDEGVQPKIKNTATITFD